MKFHQKKNPVYVPPVNPPHVQLQARDLLIFDLLVEYDGVLADYQLVALLNREAEALEQAGRHEAAEAIRTTPEALAQRANILCRGGYLHRPASWKRGQFEFGFYWLSPQGAKEKAEDPSEWRDYVFARNPDFRQTEHDVAIVDYRFIIEVVCRQNPRFELLEWNKDSEFKAYPDEVKFQNRLGRAAKRRCDPDGVYIIRDRQSGENTDLRLILEIDKDTKNANKMVDQKFLPYISWIRSPAYKRRFGLNRGWVTTVCPDENRVMLLKHKVERYIPARDQMIFHFTVAEYVEVDPDPLTEPIWWIAGEDDEYQYALFDD